MVLILLLLKSFLPRETLFSLSGCSFSSFELSTGAFFFLLQIFVYHGASSCLLTRVFR
jgi:hypothetical protein